MSLEETNKRLDELFKEWGRLQPLKPKDQERLDEKIRLEWNFNSNHIEGNTLTYGETELLLIENEEAGIHPKRDYMEMKAHDLAIEKVKELAADRRRKLTEADIKNLNQIILKEPFWKEAITEDGQKTKKEVIPGQYKKQPNHVRTETGEIFKFAEPMEVAPKMQELVYWVNAQIQTPSLLIPSLLAELHHRFILIHPFDDGNGRIARLWMNYALMRFNCPPMVIKTEDKRNYFAALQKADDGDMDTFATYLGNVLIFWLEKGISAAKGESIEDVDDLDKRISLFKREKEAEGFEVIKPLSKEVVKELHDTFFIPVFEMLESEFRQFRDFFLSGHDISFSAGSIGGNKDWKKTLETFAKNWGKEIGNTIAMKISYNHYKGAKPFNMGIGMSLILNEFTYRLEIKPRIHGTWADRFSSEERIYSRILTNSETKNLINKGKGEFFKMLQNEVEHINRYYK